MPGRVLSALQRVKARLKTQRYPRLYNVNGADENRSSRRALLVYKVRPFLTPPDSPWFLAHQNRRQCIQIARVLGELGYVVDVVDIKDTKAKPTRKYAVVVSVRVELGYLDTSLTRDATKLFIATTTDHVVQKRNLLRRHELLLKRRGRAVAPGRVYTEKVPYVVEADAIAGFGNESLLETWNETSSAKKYPFNNYGFHETRFVFESKDFANARKKFLFFASRTQVGKGLDLLLEIFPRHPDLDLYICSRFADEKEFCDCYQKELFQTPNIHPVGWIAVNSPEFYALINTCAFIVYPTCSDAQAGSVIQCMYAGLIPIVTREDGLDTEDFGVTFADDSLDEIERVVVELANLPEKWHREHSLKTRAVAEEKYSETAFIARWREILTEALPDRPAHFAEAVRKVERSASKPLDRDRLPPKPYK